ncbi:MULTISPECIES: hypothetical protein [unclassified Corallococcus]|uniref:hypothetical protein n=1 Tax=unclassified Corallococcus TaxID=2685029 RepID=UPI001A8D27EA|nr:MULTISPECIES: hypothetical protein [unclassified Corallococcus]MBN9680907.1 hypothetical protein [Corallococcus sp. NCSPR001]WAS87495.1 hypothetical protein O0N60_11055 [Corallococcus sp. NCRR]
MRERLLIRALVRLLTPEEGGTQGPVGKEFRPNWNIGSRTDDGQMALDGGFVRLDDAGPLVPGQEKEAIIEPLLSEPWLHLTQGMEIAMHAGARVIGSARILEIVRI